MQAMQLERITCKNGNRRATLPRCIAQIEIDAGAGLIPALRNEDRT